MSSSSSKGQHRVYDLLLIESQPEDIKPFLESFEATDRTNEVHVVPDGDEALDFIHQRGEYTNVSRPDLILLDINVSGQNAEDILTEFDAQSGLSRTPVLVFTASNANEDIARSYELNANAYLQKPTAEEAFRELAQSIEDFWLKQVQLPPK